MGKLLNIFYQKFSNPGVLQIIHDRNLKIDWAVESGCHDGSDTLRIAKIPSIKILYTFEPDPVASIAAQKKFNQTKANIYFSSSALWSKQGFVEMYSPNGIIGDGSSIFQFLESEQVANSECRSFFPCTTLDKEIKPISRDGLLWLDVEGAPQHVLLGGTEVLKNIVIAQIEIEMHKMSEFRDETFTRVHELMINSNFKLIKAPLHPGFFGDVIYLRKDIMSEYEIFKSDCLTTLTKILHKIIYPLLGKPKVVKKDFA